MTQPRVSVLVPTFNRVNYIGECLDSLLAQSVPALEIIVIDDGSEDGTADLLAGYVARHPTVRHLRKENGGKPTAVNLGIQQAQGELIWIFDDDDVALPEAIETRLRTLAAAPDAGFVYSPHYYGSDGPDGRIVQGRLHAVAPHDPDSFFPRLMLGCFFHLATALVKREVYLQLGGFDTQLLSSEDYDIQLRLARSCKAVLCPEPSFIFRQHQGLRGAKAIRYAGTDRSKVFRRFDQRVGRKLRENLALGEYLAPACTTPLNARDQQTALLARMQVMASKGCIPEMLEDLSAALAQPGADLATCAQMARKAVCTGYAWSAIEDDWGGLNALLPAFKGQRGGRRMVRAMALGCLALAKGYPGSGAERFAKARAALVLGLCSVL